MIIKKNSLVLVGLESAGKSAIFRGLTGLRLGDESNFRGSSVTCRHCYSQDCGCDIIDTPGLRVKSDSFAAKLALGQLQHSDKVLMVARATHLQREVKAILGELSTHIESKPAALAITFEDKVPGDTGRMKEFYRNRLGIPVVCVNARNLSHERRAELVEVIRDARPLQFSSEGLEFQGKFSKILPSQTLFERPKAGVWAAWAALLAIFSLPVYLAYTIASWVQPAVDSLLIIPFKNWAQSLPELPAAVLAGDYGLVTLGWYSFLWAFPVVLFFGFSISLCAETGLKDRITSALDPVLRKIGLSGRDLIPVLSGFGCNVVAVFQSRACSSCTRKSCISMISFASACSYQIGASLSIFGVSGHGWLFVPYLTALFVVGAIHTRIWFGKLPAENNQVLQERAFLQKPSWPAIRWQVNSTIKQFLTQAMPIFLLICAVAALLQYAGVLTGLVRIFSPLMSFFGLPSEAASGILFSVIRKDGLLILNQGEGELLAGLSAKQIFILVYLASTLTACLVTLWTIGRETGWKNAVQTAGRQVVTSVASALLISLVWGVFEKLF